MKPLTEKEQEIYDFIAQSIRRDGFSPSVRDIRSALGIRSTSTVHLYLRKLEEKGYITKEQGKSRTVRIEGDEGDEPGEDGIPIIGCVAAGLPIFAEQNFDGYVDFNAPGEDREKLFALRVKGESMIEAGIMNGDLIIVRAESCAENGDTVVVLVDDEATVKEFYKENGHYRLQPRNSKMKPIIVPECSILGRVIACVRYYE